jgi:hypothetical protein
LRPATIIGLLIAVAFMAPAAAVGETESGNRDRPPIQLWKAFPLQPRGTNGAGGAARRGSKKTNVSEPSSQTAPPPLIPPAAEKATRYGRDTDRSRNFATLLAWIMVAVAGVVSVVIVAADRRRGHSGPV